MYVFVVDGNVVVSPNTDVPPPSCLAPALEENEILIRGNQLRVFDPKYPYLPYFHSPIRSGTLFSCLNYKRDTIPIVRANRMWTIQDDVRKQWMELDKFLSSVLYTLRREIGILPVDVTLEPLPSSVPYAEPQFTESAARGCAHKALRCFQLLFTMCSWAMSYFTPLDQPETGWSKLLLKKGFSPTTVQMLRDSPIGEFAPSPPRLGVVVPVVNPAAVNSVLRMVRAHVPVWVWWGKCNPQGGRNFKPLQSTTQGAIYVNDFCYPSESDLAEAVRESLQTAAQSSSSIPATPLPTHFPKPHQGSDQRPGETWQQFFACREKRHARILERESAADRAKREARAAARPIPGRNRGARIFVWSVQVANGQVFRLREPINRFDGVSIMDNYTENQKQYNAFDDEWDLCTEFDPEGVPDSDWDEDEQLLPEQNGYAAPPTSGIPEIAPSTSSIPEPSSFQLDVFVGSEIPTSVLPSSPTLDNILYHRYGYLFPIESIHDSGSTMSLRDAASRVCEANAPLSPSNSEQNAMCSFLRLLIGAKPIPRSLCDLQDGSLLEQYKQGAIIVERRNGKYHSHNGYVLKNYYLIRPRSMSCASANGHYTIFVDDPVAVMHVIRQQWGPDVSDIASELVAAGVPFSTRVLDSAVPARPAKFRISALGYLPFDCSLSAMDYAAYLDRRDSFLHRPYSRAALMKGGIIGRLARESLDEHGDMVVRHGPSDNVLRMGTAIQLGGNYFWDDDLVEDEEQFICGVYKISTGMLPVRLVSEPN